jgi:hypothetical protein
VDLDRYAAAPESDAFMEARCNRDAAQAQLRELQEVYVVTAEELRSARERERALLPGDGQPLGHGP